MADTVAPPIEQWQREVVADVLDGKTTRHLERGAGPTLLTLRDHPSSVCGFGVVLEEMPVFPEGVDVPEDSFPKPSFAIIREETSPEPKTRPNCSVERLREFAAFVLASIHWLSLPDADVPALAFNFRDRGSVAEAAAGALNVRAKPWLRRHNRPPSSSGSAALIHVLPVDAPLCVTSDLSRFITISVGSSSQNPASVEARVFAMKTGAELLRNFGVWSGKNVSAYGRVGVSANMAGRCFLLR
jgi:hypothetical protein